MKGVFRLVAGILMGLAIVCVSVIILTNQESFLRVVMIGAGIVTLIEGIYTLFGIKRWGFSKTTRTLAIVKGILLVVFGILAVVAPISMGAALVTTFCYIYAIGLVFSAVVALQDAYVLHKLDSSIPVSGFAFEALFDILVAIIFFFNPQRIMGVAITVIGVVGILAGVYQVFGAFRTYRIEKRIEKAIVS